jgi:hypothetical protein
MRILTAAIGICSMAVSLGATVLIPIGFDDLIRESHVILHGTVISVRPEWRAGRRGIESIVTVRVEGRLKGTAGDEVSFRTPGGRMGRYRSILVGAPELQLGDEVVLFLAAQGSGLRVVGLNQGVFRIVGGTSGEKRVLPPLVQSPPGEPVPVVRGDPTRAVPTLAEFSADVRRRLGVPREAAR